MPAPSPFLQAAVRRPTMRSAKSLWNTSGFDGDPSAFWDPVGL